MAISGVVAILAWNGAIKASKYYSVEVRALPDSITIIQGNTLQGSGIVLDRHQMDLMIAINRVAAKDDPNGVLDQTEIKWMIFDDIYKTLQCESGFRHEGLFGDHGLAYGIAQYHKPTFYQYCSGDYKSKEDQLYCMVKMWIAGGQSHWTCAKKEKVIRSYGDIN